MVDWKDAIRTSVQPLVVGHYVEERYIDGVIENTNVYVPYYVLAQDFALIHAKSDQGVIEKRLAVTVLKELINFSEDGYSVRLLVVLATDGESHMAAIAALTLRFL
ncbi:MAG: PTS sugar transporter subunit IIA [Anaerorhabdus sp.]